MQNEFKPVRSFRGDYLPKPQSSFGFTKDQTYSIEIGAGVGLHACSYAAANPNIQHIAIERTKEKFKKLKNRAIESKLNNLKVFHDDGINWLYHNANNVFFKSIFLLYPNPYPKNSSYRWVRMPYFRELIKYLDIDSEILFASNEKFYMDEVELYCEKYWNLKPIYKKELHEKTLAPEYQPLTHFEKKYLERGLCCYHYSYGIPTLSEKL